MKTLIVFLLLLIASFASYGQSFENDSYSIEITFSNNNKEVRIKTKDSFNKEYVYFYSFACDKQAHYFFHSLHTYISKYNEFYQIDKDFLEELTIEAFQETIDKQVCPIS